MKQDRQKKRGGRAGKIRAGAWMLMAAAVLLAGCRKQQVLPEPEKRELSLWYYFDMPQDRKRLLTLVNEFNLSHETAKIKTRYIPDEDFKKTLALAIADGIMPDLAIVDSSDVSYYDAMGSLADLTDCMDETLYSGEALKGCRRPAGGLAGLPLGLNCLVFYYNTDILRDAGVEPPKSLDEFVDAAVALTTDEVSGCAFPSIQSEEGTFCFLPILWGYGGDVMDIDSEAGAKAFDFFRRIAREGAMNRSSVNMTLSDISKEFAEGNVAMMFAPSGREPQIQRENPNLNFEVAMIPNGEHPVTVAGGEVLIVTSQKQKEEALSFVRFMSDAKRMKTYLGDFGYLAPRTDVLGWQIARNPEMQRYAACLATAQARTPQPYWPAVSMALMEAVNQVILQEEPPDMLEVLADKIAEIREEYHEGG